MKSEKNIKINIPDNELFTGAVLFYKNNEGVYESLDKDFVKYESSYLVNCGNQDKCVSAKKQMGDNIKIYLPRPLFEEISEITFFAFRSSSSKCSHLEFDVLLSGVLDKQSILAKNPCLLSIPGMEQKYKLESKA